uniref:Saposin B-type domain-containing protein n=1 Tax=Heterorhabditis bacteriophora TaxID=37862 RepID=A0A1I7XUQ1_HETBA
MRLLWLCILVETCHFGYSTRSNCKQCDFAVELLHSAWEEKTTSTCIGDLAEFICTTFNIEDHFVCKGIAGEFKDEFTYVLSVIIIEPHQICGLLMKDCGTFIDPLSVSWNITIPSNQPSPIDKKTVFPGKPILRVLHLTDLHLDMLYTPGLEAKCKEPQCCRPQQNPNELGKSKVSQMAGPWGTVGNCDVPYWLLINMLEFVRKNHRDLDYILVTGDITSHADWDYTPTSHVAMIKNISETLKSMGCYMKKIYPGLRLISINNALGGDALNFFLYINQTDPDGTLTWLIKQLSMAEKEGDVVHILAHIPGGDGEALEGWAINYYKVVNRFQNIIVGQFFGHTHSEEFYITYDDPEDSSSRPTSVVYSAPSLTTYSDLQNL